MIRIDPDTAEILDVAPFEYTRLAEELTALPREFNAPWTEGDIFRTEVSCPVLSRMEKLMISERLLLCYYRSYQGK
jgi:hypothetical protein